MSARARSSRLLGVTHRRVSWMTSNIPAVATPSRTNPIVHGLAEMCLMMMGTAPIIRMVTAASSTSRMGEDDTGQAQIAIVPSCHRVIVIVGA